MTIVNVFDAKSQFSRLIATAEAGETITIARNGRPVAQLGPIPAKPGIVIGDLAGERYWMADDFDELDPAFDNAWSNDPNDPVLA
jgi:prevent-host-death family protein